MENTYKFQINDRIASFHTEFWLLHTVNGKVFNVTMGKFGLEEIEIKDSDVKDYDKHRPLLVLPRELTQIFVDALIEKTPPSKKERIEGELEATKFHLADLRKLLKL